MKKSFNEKCYSILRKVPKGKVTTYGEIARALKSKGCRAVGNAMHRNPYGFLTTANSTARLRSRNKKELTVNQNPYAPKVPCHRVVGSDGKMIGFASGIDEKIKMLKREGVEVVNNKVDLTKYLYKFR